MDDKIFKLRLSAVVYGLVQGVGFRYFCKRHADRLGITGYAKNLMDGSVEIAAEGDKQRLLMFLDDVKKGPSLSHVESVNAVWEKAEEKFTFFRVL